MTVEFEQEGMNASQSMSREGFVHRVVWGSFGGASMKVGTDGVYTQVERSVGLRMGHIRQAKVICLALKSPHGRGLVEMCVPGMHLDVYPFHFFSVSGCWSGERSYIPVDEGSMANAWGYLLARMGCHEVTDMATVL